MDFTSLKIFNRELFMKVFAKITKHFLKSWFIDHIDLTKNCNLDLVVLLKQSSFNNHVKSEILISTCVDLRKRSDESTTGEIDGQFLIFKSISLRLEGLLLHRFYLSLKDGSSPHILMFFFRGYRISAKEFRRSFTSPFLNC